MITSQAINKMAGLLEGEGCFGFNHGSPWIQLGMADRDVVTEAARTFGGCRVRRCKPHGKGKKPQYRTYVFGARAVGWMMTLYSLMGRRRRARIKDVLKAWCRTPLTGSYRYHATGDRTVPTCHPERQHNAHGLCLPCYKKERMA